jgi:penicillin amidase
MAMTRPMTQALRAALPTVEGTLSVPGLRVRVESWRDLEGVPHVRAGSVADAFFGQGFVHAQDRLWQMEYDRRRAYGRWAEYAGPAGVPGDVQMRRFRLGHSARADWAVLNPETRAMLDAYAAGVNAFLATTSAWPIEFQLLDARPEPWQPWDSLAVFKVRHVDMGTWQIKLWRARLLQHLGPEFTAQLCPGTQPNPMLIVPPATEYCGPTADGLAALADLAATPLPNILPWDQGSNNWAVAGSRTASGRPLVAGDPHRALDVPSVYYQNHVACPEFDVIGLSFAGVPGLPHFGHNAAVAWCVTHTMADYQDLYLERFDPQDPRRYQWLGDWRHGDVRRETILVRGASAVEIETWHTHHGPVLLGDPRRGYALAVRYTATAEPNRTFEAFLPMMQARSADDLDAAVRVWVEPVNNLVLADVHGTIGYRTRGQVPLRSSANAWGPVPGWTGTHEWRGTIPFDEMPAVRNPPTGFVVSANSRVAGPDYPHYLGLDVAPDFRTRRLVERLSPLVGATARDMADILADRVSIPARELLVLLRNGIQVGADVGTEDKEPLETLLAWDGVVDRDSVAATIYATLRERLIRTLMTPILGALVAEAFTGAPRGGPAHMSRLKARLTEMIGQDDRTLLPAGADWREVLGRALVEATAELRAMLGPDAREWRWGRIHATQPQHPLSSTFPEWAGVLNPPSVALGGDGDTIQAAGFFPANGFGITVTSVARYVFDLGDWERSAWVVPLGASGHPASPRYADQVTPWSGDRLVPMRYDWSRIASEAERHQVLEPA